MIINSAGMRSKVLSVPNRLGSSPSLCPKTWKPCISRSSSPQLISWWPTWRACLCPRAGSSKSRSWNEDTTHLSLTWAKRTRTHCPNRTWFCPSPWRYGHPRGGQVLVFIEGKCNFPTDLLRLNFCRVSFFFPLVHSFLKIWLIKNSRRVSLVCKLPWNNHRSDLPPVRFHWNCNCFSPNDGKRFFFVFNLFDLGC